MAGRALFALPAQQQGGSMGTWGVGIFSEDTTVDVRDQWRDLISGGLSPEEATERLVAQWVDALDDPDDGLAFWLGLAAAQMNTGRLLERVQAEAISIIDSGRDLGRWDDPGERGRRKAVLARLRAQLLGPQRVPTKIRKRHVQRTSLRPGDIFTYRRRSGKLAIFRVRQIVSDSRGDVPQVELLDFEGEELPDDLQVEHLPGRPDSRPRSSAFRREETVGYRLLDGPGVPEPVDRIRVVARASEQWPALPAGVAMVGLAWDTLDVALDRVFSSDAPGSSST